MKELTHLDVELCESAISHLLNRFSKHSIEIRDTDFRTADGICLLPCEIDALSRLHDFLLTSLE